MNYVGTFQKNTTVVTSSIPKAAQKQQLTNHSSAKSRNPGRLIDYRVDTTRGGAVRFLIHTEHPLASHINRDLEAEFLARANLLFEERLAKRPDISIEAVALFSCLRVSNLVERRLMCYLEHRHRHVLVRASSTGRMICIGAPFCWYPDECVAPGVDHGGMLAKARSHGWYGQLTQSLATNLVDLNRAVRGLPPASWYEIEMLAPVDFRVPAGWKALITSTLDVADRYRKDSGFRWGDLLNKRGTTPHGRPRVPIIDAHADEWLAEGWIRLLLRGISKKGINPAMRRQLQPTPGEGVVPSTEKGQHPVNTLSFDGTTPYVSFNLLVYGPAPDVARLEDGWKRRTEGLGSVCVNPVWGPEEYIGWTTKLQIEDWLRLPGEIRALLYRRRAQRHLKQRFHLGASYGVQEKVEQLWKELGQRALEEAACEGGLNLEPETELIPLNNISPRDQETSKYLRDRRTALQQKYFTQELPLLIARHHEQLETDSGLNIDEEAKPGVHSKVGLSIRPSTFTPADELGVGGVAKPELYSGSGPSIRPSRFRRADDLDEEDAVRELVEQLQSAQTKQSAELARFIEQMNHKLAMLEQIPDLRDDIARIREVLERRSELADVEVKKEFHALELQLRSNWPN